MHARRSLLYLKNEPWVKRTGNERFDVTMGSHDGAEACETVGLFLLHQLQDVLPRGDVGLYRDDGLAVLRGASGPKADQVRKVMVDLFKRNGLALDIKTNLKKADYLDLTLNLENDSYQTYNKPNNDPLYINKLSNHPPAITKHIPRSVSKRISSNSSNEQIFRNSAPYFDNILKRSGYDQPIQYFKDSTPNSETNIRGSRRKNNRKNRNVIWYNPPWSINVKTNIGHIFLKLISKHFGGNTKLGKIFNRSRVKVSYSCVQNMSSIIKNHNKKILNPPKVFTRSCNCRNRETCPLNGLCLTPNVVYAAEVTAV